MEDYGAYDYPDIGELDRCYIIKNLQIQQQYAICASGGRKHPDCMLEAFELVCNLPKDEIRALLFTGGNHTLLKNDIFMYTDYSSIPESMAARCILMYLPPFVLTIGTLGNIITSIIMQRIAHSVWSTCLYLAVLPIVETLWLWVQCGDKWLNKLADLQLSNQLLMTSNATCKIYPFIINFVIHFVQWLIVAATFEGFCVIRFPKRSRVMCTFERARAVIMLLTVLLICINAQFFWTYELVMMDGRDDKPRGIMCTFADKSTTNVFQDLIWPTIDTMVAEILPITVILVLTALMIGTYIKTNGRPSKEEEKMHKYMLDPDAFCDLKVSYIAVAVMYLLLVTPLFAYKVFAYATKKEKLQENNARFDAQGELAEAITLFLLFIFLSCKMFAYLVTCKRFRYEFLRIMCYCYYRKSSRKRVYYHDEIAQKPLMTEKGGKQKQKGKSSSRWNYGKVTEV
ncbi:growth hormone secretagogue receptor type 1-like isoform X2 [Lineus longissimus]|uniref:growth hormone secretagogue receptor type 1-like isoform X2 n=1 Tax=Lineus longissimus TaxID=88925 RepID=UPI00315D3639